VMAIRIQKFIEQSTRIIRPAIASTGRIEYVLAPWSC
jgi:hypothetical protein